MNKTTPTEILRRYKAGERSFVRINVNSCNLSGFDLSGADFSRASFDDADLKGYADDCS